MLSFKDQLGRTIHLEKFPTRIISVVPSQTELLSDLGLDEEVIGITKFCVHPETWFRTKTRIGGTKNLDIEKIRGLKPDLVIANLEENVKVQIEEIEEFCPVWISDVHDLDSAIVMIHSVSEMVGQKEKGSDICSAIFESFFELEPAFTVATYLIWKDPMMTVGGDTFISYMMGKAGFVNEFGDKKRYPEVTDEQLKNTAVILLSTEPYPFTDADVEEFTRRYNTPAMLVDGEMFSWYGSRMKLAAPYFKQLREQYKSL